MHPVTLINSGHTNTHSVTILNVESCNITIHLQDVTPVRLVFPVPSPETTEIEMTCTTTNQTCKKCIIKL